MAQKDEDVFLNDAWKLYYHSPEDDDWRLESYVPIAMISSVRDLWTAVNTSAPWMQDGMFFLMREYVQPVWDDPAVIEGGCYSIRVPRDNALSAMVDMMTAACGETILAADIRDRWASVCGVSISPKNSFNVIKVWLGPGEVPTESQLWMPSTRTKEVFYSPFRDQISRSKKPPAPAPSQAVEA